MNMFNLLINIAEKIGWFFIDLSNKLRAKNK